MIFFYFWAGWLDLVGLAWVCLAFLRIWFDLVFIYYDFCWIRIDLGWFLWDSVGLGFDLIWFDLALILIWL